MKITVKTMSITQGVLKMQTQNEISSQKRYTGIDNSCQILTFILNKVDLSNNIMWEKDRKKPPHS